MPKGERYFTHQISCNRTLGFERYINLHGNKTFSAISVDFLSV